MGQRRPWEVDDGLWERITPLLPVVERRTAVPGAQTAGGPTGARRDPVLAVHGDPLGVPAAGAGVRLRKHVPAQTAGLAPGRGVAGPARAAARRVTCGRPAGLLPGRGGRLAPSGDEGRCEDRA